MSCRPTSVTQYSVSPIFSPWGNVLIDSGNKEGQRSCVQGLLMNITKCRYQEKRAKIEKETWLKVCTVALHN